MSITLADVQQRLEEAVEADGTFVLSAHEFDDFPPAKDSGDVLHRAFAVGLLSTETAEGRQRRGSGHVGAWCLTDVRVRVCFHARADDRRGSYREALDDEERLVSLLLGRETDPELQLRWEGTVNRALAGPSVRMHELQFTAHHHYSLIT